MNTENFKKKNAFSFSWQPTNHNDTHQADDFYSMRDWQIDAFEQFKSEDFMILNAPMGSGKSWMMCLLSAFKMKKNSLLRTVIAVPQTIIAPGFAEAKIQMPGGEKVHWQIKNNLCKSENNKGTVNSFIRWLENPVAIFHERTLLCTHATLIAVYKKLKAENRLFLFNDILLWIDEAHHVKNIIAEGLNGATISNGIGEIVSHFLSVARDVQLGLTTASFFRGDRATLITDEMEAKFKRFNLPYDEYLQTMRYLKSFSFNFLICGPDYIKGINAVVQSRKGKDIIYIPHPVSQFSSGDKHQEVNNIIQIYGTPLHTTEHGVHIVQGKQSKQKILNLVCEQKRKQKKAYLDHPILKKQEDALDVIVALGMFKEGANWIHADRSIIVGARTSLVDVIQMVGRLFRDAPGKMHVEVIQLLPFSLDQQDEDKFRENLNNYMKAIFASLILENILNPVKIKPLSKKNDEQQLEGDGLTRTNWLNVVLPDETKQILLEEDVINHLLDIWANNKDIQNDTAALFDKYMKTVPSILEEHNIHKHKEEVAQQFWNMFLRRSMQLEGLSVENIDFDLVQKANPLEFLLQYTSGTCNINTFKDFREAIKLSRIEWRSFKEAREFVRSLNLKSETEWRLYIGSKLTSLIPLPKDIPTHPDRIYKNIGWISWGDFLGTDRVANQKREYLSFEEARDYIRNLKFKNRDEFAKWAQTKSKPLNVPADPAKVYKNDGWLGWGGFLGTDRIANQYRKYLPFEEARDYVRNLKFKNRAEFLKWAQSTNRSLNIPTHPARIYRNNGWLGWGDFLGTNNISFRNKKYAWRPFEEARDYVQQFKFKNREEFNKWARSNFKPNDIPAKPWQVYVNDGWTSLGDFLGTGRIASQNRTFRPFQEARTYVRQLNLKNQGDWRKWAKSKDRPPDIPTTPDRTYAVEWKGWKDWLKGNNDEK